MFEDSLRDGPTTVQAMAPVLSGEKSWGTRAQSSQRPTTAVGTKVHETVDERQRHNSLVISHIISSEAFDREIPTM